MPGSVIHSGVMQHVAKALAESGYTPSRSERIDPRISKETAEVSSRLTSGLAETLRDLSGEVAGILTPRVQREHRRSRGGGAARPNPTGR